MLQWLINLAEFSEFIEILFYLGKTPMITGSIYRNQI